MLDRMYDLDLFPVYHRLTRPVLLCWGRGRTGSGKNMLGRILMRTRGRLRIELAESA
ncbi:hypothetical protein ACFU53_24965 [Streptomyces sp. NPDC057474]|uniref:hypothetical protein n=1 Tax=Streptomyces sp. NPDC057474 TaxID=3346144 RepID=UPI00367A7133